MYYILLSLWANVAEAEKTMSQKTASDKLPEKKRKRKIAAVK